MAIAYDVQGPCKVQWNGTTDLGYVPPDVLIEHTEQIFQRELKSDQYGDETEEIIHTGAQCLVQMTLVKYDRTQLEALKKKARAGASTVGAAGTVGALLVSGGHVFSLVVAPLRTGKKTRTYGRCYLPQDGLREFDWGTEALKVGLSVIALRDASGNYYTEA